MGGHLGGRQGLDEELLGSLPAVLDSVQRNAVPALELIGQELLLEFEFADDTASDFESYDAVAADRAAQAGAPKQ
ncbi:MAG TPA: hypothetical protein VGL49_08055 [Acidimicrobiales bacterium]